MYVNICVCGCVSVCAAYARAPVEVVVQREAAVAAAAVAAGGVQAVLVVAPVVRGALVHVCIPTQTHLYMSPTKL